MSDLIVDWNKGDGLIPAIVQHWRSGAVLMFGYMNAEALAQTQQSGKVTFYSRSKRRLWTKGETSGHFLLLKSFKVDCDNDTILIQAEAQGPTCHKGTRSCFGDEAAAAPPLAFLAELDALIEQRERERPAGSYTTKLFEEGLRRIAQKVGEEGVEIALAAVAQDEAAVRGEAADLLFHLLVLLRAKGIAFDEVVGELRRRHAK
ncbi:MAG: bifunctional phosphoribosyl-AMP cyclohydrolase/phosphoribosyl-ATP diphosphatase HisIE [Gammaproteobacteria bacterium]|nr:MAG: bifunctional phosphoribosyl-AMP cyclohydrolase/phosphoribosyl-ATP diphosphatase HisIE [Gammaproteobacteria bacterium]